MKKLFWTLLPISVAVIAAGIAISRSSATSDPGSLSAPTLSGVGVFVSTAGATLAAIVLAFAAWWRGIASALSNLQRERSTEVVFIAQATKTLRELDSDNTSWPASTYVVCAVSRTAFEVWANDKLLLSVASLMIDDVSLGTAVTSRPVPALVFSGKLGAFEVVPGRTGWELFPMLDRGKVAELGNRILRTMDEPS